MMMMMMMVMVMMMMMMVMMMMIIMMMIERREIYIIYMLPGCYCYIYSHKDIILRYINHYNPPRLVYTICGLVEKL
jgi:hypothetical protein